MEDLSRHLEQQYGPEVARSGTRAIVALIRAAALRVPDVLARRGPYWMASHFVALRYLAFLGSLWPCAARAQMDTIHGFPVPWPTVNMALVGNTKGATFAVAPLLADQPGPADDSIVELHLDADSLRPWLARARRLLAIGESLQAANGIRLLTTSVRGTLGGRLALLLDHANPPGRRLLFQIRAWDGQIDWSIGAPVDAGPPLLDAVERALALPPEPMPEGWPATCTDLQPPRQANQPTVFGPKAFGRAWISYLVDAKGHVPPDQTWLLLADSPEAAARALATVRQTQYVPAKCDGHPVPLRMSRHFAFHLAP